MTAPRRHTLGALALLLLLLLLSLPGCGARDRAPQTDLTQTELTQTELTPPAMTEAELTELERTLDEIDQVLGDLDAELMQD